MDPLASSKSRAALKTPQSFLGENSALVNLDQLIQAPVPTAQPAAYNPFGDIQQPSKTNLFQQQMQPVSSRPDLIMMGLSTMKSVREMLWRPTNFSILFSISTGDQYDSVATKESSPSALANWESKSQLTPLNLCYNTTPPEVVSAVVTEVAILPCTSEFSTSTFSENQNTQILAFIQQLPAERFFSFIFAFWCIHCMVFHFAQ